MNFEILHERDNPLMGRKETTLVVHHAGRGTPDRISIREFASEHFSVPLDRVYVKSIATRTGGSSAICAIEVYKDKETANSTVPPFLKNRNLRKDQRVSKSKKPEEAKPTATPKAAPAEKPQSQTKGQTEKTEAKAAARPAAPSKEPESGASQEPKKKA